MSKVVPHSASLRLNDVAAFRIFDISTLTSSNSTNLYFFSIFLFLLVLSLNSTINPIWNIEGTALLDKMSVCVDALFITRLSGILSSRRFPRFYDWRVVQVLKSLTLARDRYHLFPSLFSYELWMNTWCFTWRVKKKMILPSKLVSVTCIKGILLKVQSLLSTMICF